MKLGFDLDDTIVGIATPTGGAIAVIRISGSRATDILGQMFTCQKFDSHRVYYGWIHDNSVRIDEVLSIIMLAPRSFTRQDMVEIHCHGSAAAVSRIFDLAVSRGARAARPGEFSARAFLNGRIDLSQAEAIMDMVNAGSDRALREGAQQLSGQLGRHIRALCARLLAMLARIEMAIDYPEYEEADLATNELEPALAAVLEDVNILAKTARQGQLIRDGVRVALIGLPNSGKSSLLNALLMHDRAIVTEIPGTTRDVLTEHMRIADISICISDTAGIRKSEDIIEQIGIDKSLKTAADADLVVLVIDGATPISPADMDSLTANFNNLLIAINKCDLPQKLDKNILTNYAPPAQIIEISAKNHIGLTNLCEKIANIFFGDTPTQDSTPTITNARHAAQINAAQAALTHAQAALAESQCLDLIAIDLSTAHHHLSEITGESATETLLDKIFADFCLGK